MRLFLSLILTLGILVTLAACGYGNSTSTTSTSTTTTTTTTSPTTTTTTITTGQTIGQLAVQGQTVYALNCASCHGAQGQGGVGPALTGQFHNLRNHGNAGNLLTRIATTMPWTAPGSLSQQQYWQVLCFLLIQDGFATAGTVFDANNLSQIPLT